MNNINDLKKAVVNQPELVATVDALDENRNRLAKLIFDLGRLDEALMQRIVMFEGIKMNSSGSTSEIANNCQQLLITISSFINMASTAPSVRANSADEIFKDLMKRM
jgi:hypothetical protein